MGNLAAGFLSASIRIVALALFICSCGYATTDTTLKAEGSTQLDLAYVHPYSGFAFPKQIDDFRFVETTKYDRDGRDVSVGYNSPTPIAATVYVYPAPKNLSLLPAPPVQGVSQFLIANEFGRREQEIVQAHPDARLHSEQVCEIVQEGNHFSGKKAIYTMAYTFGASSQDCVSELYLFLIEPGTMFLIDDRQYVQYRITYPSAVKGRAAGEVASFLSKLTWPVKRRAEPEPKVPPAVGAQVLKTIYSVAMLTDAYREKMGAWPDTIQVLRTFEADVAHGTTADTDSQKPKSVPPSVEWAILQRLSFRNLNDGSLEVDFTFSKEYLESHGAKIEGQARARLVTRGQPDDWRITLSPSLVQ